MLHYFQFRFSELTGPAAVITCVVFVFCILFRGATPAVWCQVPESIETGDRLDSIKQKAASGGFLRSMLIQQNDSLLVKAYYNGVSAKHPYNIKSASKSILSILIGIAADQGELSLNQTLEDFFPGYFSRYPDSVKSAITIRQMLSMQAGLETASFHNYGRWVQSDNWTKWVLERDMVANPGGEMVYSTGISHLLSVILTKATGLNTRAFAMNYLFRPLDIRPGGWDRDPQGYYMGGNNLALRPEDMLKIGRMMLNGGVWQGRRIVSEQWVEDSFNSYSRSNFNPYDYGYMWWNKTVSRVSVYFAWGFGGQYIFVIPELEAVAVFTSNLAVADNDRSYKSKVFDLLEKEIIPLLKKRR